MFDYYMEPKRNSGNFRIDDFIKNDKKLLVFSSHGHGDHLIVRY